MLQKVKPIKGILDAFEYVLLPVAFQNESQKLLREYIFTENKGVGSLTDLERCFIWPDHFCVRCGLIHTQEKARQWFLIVDELRQRDVPLRIVSHQFNDPNEEWHYIRAQHQSLMAGDSNEKNQIAHLILSTNLLFYDPKNELEGFQTKSLEKLQKQLNLEAWEIYCHWLNEEMENFLRRFLLDDLQEYQLEACLKDFSHEVHSFFTRKYREEIHDLLKEEVQEEAKGNLADGNQLLEWEKRIIKLRGNLKAGLQIKCALLKVIEQNLGKIEEFHPELQQLRVQVLLLQSLMQNPIDMPGAQSSSWGQQILRHFLLNKYLKAITSINCDSGLDRTHVVFAIKLALHKLSLVASEERVLDLAMHWDETLKSMYTLVSQRGIRFFQHWLKGPTGSIMERSANLRAALAFKFQNYFLEALKQTALIINRECGFVQPADISAWVENRAIAEFFPLFRDEQTESVENKTTLFAIIENEKFIGLTEPARQLLATAVSGANSLL